MRFKLHLLVCLTARLPACSYCLTSLGRNSSYRHAACLRVILFKLLKYLADCTKLRTGGMNTDVTPMSQI